MAETTETAGQKPKSLVSKLTEVMKQVKHIEKKGYNSFHKYNYATESDVAEKVREVLAQENVMMIPNMTKHEVREHINAKGKTEYIATVDMEFTFYDGDSDAKLTFNIAGEGQDAGDKGIYKAITGAQKYALMKVFMIPTGDDPEADTKIDERNYSQQNQQRQNGNQNPNNPPKQNYNNGPKLASSNQINLVKRKVKELAPLHKMSVERVYEELKITEAGLPQMTSADTSKLIDNLSIWIDSAKAIAQAGA